LIAEDEEMLTTAQTPVPHDFQPSQFREATAEHRLQILSAYTEILHDSHIRIVRERALDLGMSLVI
jgi:hypothetical protein